MKSANLFFLVKNAQAGNKEAMAEIIQMFEPAIQKACRRTHPNERHDLGQYLSEKIIIAVLNYDQNSVSKYSKIMNEFLD